MEVSRGQPGVDRGHRAQSSSTGLQPEVAVGLSAQSRRRTEPRRVVVGHRVVHGRRAVLRTLLPRRRPASAALAATEESPPIKVCDCCVTIGYQRARFKYPVVRRFS